VTSAPATGNHFYAEDLPMRTKILIMISVMLGLLLSALDQTIVSTAMPAIIRDLQGLDYVAWTSTAYLLASTAMVPIYGKLSDLYGRRIILLAGISIFLGGSILCGLSQDIFQLIGFRVIQGIGSAALTSTAFAIPADLFSPAERPRYMGIFGAVFGMASIIGPFLGGFLTDAVNWRWVFYVNLPVGIIALFFIIRVMPSMSRGIKAAIDYAGSVTLVLGIVPLLLALTLDKELHAWNSPLIVGLFAMAVVFIGVFLWVEQRAESPIINLALFKDQIFSVTMFSSFLNGAAFFGAFLFLSLFLVNVLGVSATEAGSAQIPLMLSFVVSSIVASQLVARTGRYKPLILFGFALMLVGFYFMTQLSMEMQSRDIVWRMILLGMGMGPVVPLLNLAMQNAMSHQHMGTAVANRQFFQQLGQAVGAAVFGVILTTTLTHQIQTELHTVVTKLPPALQSQFDVSAMRNSMAGSSEGQSGQGFEQRITDKVNTRFDELERQLTAVANGDEAAKSALLADTNTSGELKQLVTAGQLNPQSLPMIIQSIEQTRATTLTQVTEIGVEIQQSLKRAFTTSIINIYFNAIWLVVISLITVVFLLPELPLRKSNRDEPVVSME